YCSLLFSLYTRMLYPFLMDNLEMLRWTVKRTASRSYLRQKRIFSVEYSCWGHANNPKCFSQERGGRTTSISIPLDECGSVKTRSIDPPGLFISTKVMLSFHSQFVTKVDRGYDIQCFYMQADKTVTYPLMVSMNPVAPFSVVAEMPRCRYEVIDPHTKHPIEVTTVGQQLLHTWTCESSSPELWCMRVHSCKVEDDQDTEVTVLDDAGCAIDRYLLDNLEYGPGNLRAQKEAHAFKFAEDVVVNFQCSIRLDIKTTEECDVPTCPDVSGRRRRRSEEENEKEKEDGLLNARCESSIHADTRIGT
ncbi:hypothetical protein PFISCL1PPCAC_28962, partial [Pristionchus fissidentatus]